MMKMEPSIQIQKIKQNKIKEDYEAQLIRRQCDIQ